MGLPQSGPFLFRSGGGGGTSSGAAGINYLSAIYAGDTLTNINQYDDGASSIPTNGTGGSPTGLTTALNTSTPLVGTSCVRFSKDASNRQGMGWSYDFTVDDISSDRSTPVFIQFYYRTSANYASSDLRVFVYDKDSATLLTVQDISNNSGNIIAASGDALFTGVFYTTSGNDDYRLIWHIASTNASAWDLDLDCFVCSPQSVVPGYLGAYLGSESWTVSEANATSTVYLYRDGAKLRVIGRVAVTGIFSGSNFTVTIPAAYTPDPTTYANRSNANAARYNVGRAELIDYGSSAVDGNVTMIEGNSLRIFATVTTGTYGGDASITASAPFSWASGDYIFWNADFVVQNWATSAALSTTEALFSTQSAIVTGDPASASSGNPIIFPTVTFDSIGNAYNASTGRLTVARSGLIRVSGTMAQAGGGAATVYIYKNAVQNAQAGTFSGAGAVADINATVQVNAGDIVDLRPNATVDVNANNQITWAALPNFSIFSTYGTTELLPATGYSSGGLVNYVTTAGNYGDLDSEVLTPGEWDLSAMAVYYANGAVTTTTVGIGISTTSGNSATGLVLGETYMADTKSTATTTLNPITLEVKGIVVTAPTTYYFKSLAVTSITNLQIAWSWRFRRVK